MQTSQEIVDRILTMASGAVFLLLAPKIRGKKGEHKDIFDEIVMYEGPGTPYVSRINNIIRECRKVPEGMKQDEAIEEAYSLLSAVRGCHS